MLYYVLCIFLKEDIKKKDTISQKAIFFLATCEVIIFFLNALFLDSKLFFSIHLFLFPLLKVMQFL